jgi:hypothetical protein
MNANEPPEGMHGDPDRWPDGLGEPGEFQVHDACPECGCNGRSGAVRFIPVDSQGSGVLTPEEYAYLVRRARRNFLDADHDEWESLESVEPEREVSDDDVVMRIEGFRDGSFLVKIIAGPERGHFTGGVRRFGANGWRHGLVLCTNAVDITTKEDEDAGVLVYKGEPGVLNFKKRPYDKDSRTLAPSYPREMYDRASHISQNEREKQRIAKLRPPRASPEATDSPTSSSGPL